MLLSQPVCDRVTIELYAKSTPRRKMLSLDQWTVGTVTIGAVQEMLQEMRTQTVVSGDWRDYVDHRPTYKQNVRTTKP
ncbi:hypothetical protein LTR36_004989 [Oleoguttula mirabilis]|uniref:Uncharacterized protein n=1 Tax=Oleoguttula mirabilis TaxID=1507867 RepID=A0AAV9JX43_9PEZI|nr:hypothetical protein LTR36_004989 [Oleoguttula mirabilis]